MSKERMPKLCRHRGSGLAYVTDPRTGKETYLGAWGSPEAEQAYEDWCRDYRAWRRLGRPAPAGAPLPGETPGLLPRGRPLSVAELCERFLDHAEDYYRKGGRPTSTVGAFRRLLRRLNAGWGRLPAESFGPQDLKALRAQAVEAGRLRTEANREAGQCRAVWRWGVAEGLVPAATLLGLQAVPDIRKGRGGVEAPEVGPVAPEVVGALLAHLRPMLRALVLFQWHGAMRPGEAVLCRGCDVDRGGEPWEYRPCSYKTEHHET